MPADPQLFILRRATPADAPIIARHRARMWQDMGDLPDDWFEPLRARAELHFHELLDKGDYVGWFAASSDDPGKIVAGAGVQLRNSLPSPRKENGRTVGVTTGKLGLLINVFTEPEWRRRGAAVLLMKTIIAWARAQRLDRLVLHASTPDAPSTKRWVSWRRTRCACRLIELLVVLYALAYACRRTPRELRDA